MLIHAGGAIWLNLLVTVLFSVYTVECYVLYPCCMGVFPVMYGRRLFSSVFFSITERRDIGPVRGALVSCWVLEYGLC